MSTPTEPEPEPEPMSAPATSARGSGRWLQASTGAALAGVTGMVAGVAAPGVAAAGVAAAEVAPDESPAPAQGCSAPTDGQLIHSVELRDGDEGLSWGTAQLWYSPSCDAVLAKAWNIGDTCQADGLRTKAFVVHNGEFTASVACAIGGNGLVHTPWVSNVGIQQAAKGQVWSGDQAFAAGATPAF